VNIYRKLILLSILFFLSSIYVFSHVRLAILPFENAILPEQIESDRIGLLNINSRYNYLGDALTDILITEISRVENVKVLERDEVQKLLDEIEVGSSGLIDERTIIKAGNVIQADYLFFGYIRKKQHIFSIEGKLLNLKTKKVQSFEKEYKDEKELFEFGFTFLKEILNRLNLPLKFTSSTLKIKRYSRIAVLPFKNNSKNHDIDYLSSGLSELISAELSETGYFKVVERERIKDILKEIELGLYGLLSEETSAKIGRMLSARYLLFGSFFQAGKKIRIDIRVTDVETGLTQFYSSVKGDMNNIYQMVEKLCQKIMQNSGVKAKFNEEYKRKKLPNSIEAYIYYKRGMYDLSKVCLTGNNKYIDEAIEEFKRALYVEPKYKDAFFKIVELKKDLFWLRSFNQDILSSLYDLLAKSWDSETKAFVLWKLGEIKIGSSPGVNRDGIRLWEKSFEKYSPVSIVVRDRYRYIGEIFEQAGEKENADLYFEKALKMNYELYNAGRIDESQYLLFNIKIYENRFDFEKGFAACEKFLQRFPKHPEYMDVTISLEKFSAKVKNFDDWFVKRSQKEIFTCEEAIKSHNYNPRRLTFPYFHLELMYYYFKKGQYKKGFSLYERIKNEFPFLSDRMFLIGNNPFSKNEHPLLKGLRKFGKWVDYFRLKKVLLFDDIETERYMDSLTKVYNEFLNQSKKFNLEVSKELNLKKNRWVLEISGNKVTSLSINSKFKDVNFLGDELKIGRDTLNNTGIWRCLTQIDFSKLPKNVKIISAKLYLYGLSSQFGKYSTVDYFISPMNLFETLSPWKPEDVTWKSSVKIDKEPIPTDDISYMNEIRAYVYTFDITRLLKRRYPMFNTIAFCIMEFDEDNQFKKAPSMFYGEGTVLEPKVVIIFESKNPIKYFTKYRYNWKDLYSKGMECLSKRRIKEAIIYWKEALKYIYNIGIKEKIQEHIKIVSSYAI